MFKKNLRNIVMAMIVLFACVVYCNKEDNILPKSDPASDLASNIIHPKPSYKGVKIKDGALHFETIEVFNEITEQLGKLSRTNREEWEKGIGFTSLLTHIDQKLIEISRVEKEEEIKNIVAKHSEIIKISENNVVEPVVMSSLYAAIANKDGIFYCGNCVHKVKGGLIAIARDNKNEKSLTEALNRDIPNNGAISNENDIAVIEYFSEIPIKRNASTTLTTISNELINRDRDRKIAIKMWISINTVGSSWPTLESAMVFNVKTSNYKKNIWGKYVDHPTNCEVSNVNATIWYNDTYGDFYGVKNIFLYGAVCNNDNILGFEGWDYVLSYRHVSTFYWNRGGFITANASTTHRGMQGAWCTLTY